MLCVLGSLLNDDGKLIKEEMLSWLNKEHNVLCVDQEPPGKYFEYPAIQEALKLSIQSNQPVLYLHTKGAGNPIPSYYKERQMAPCVNYPKNAKPEDCQKIVRMMWKKEFTGERLQHYLKAANTEIPTVVCPLTGKERLTWNNGWIINPNGAKELLKTFHLDTNRYYYECMFQYNNIKIVGILSEDCNLSDMYHKKLWDITWQFYEN